MLSSAGLNSVGRARILVADDHEASRMLAEAYLLAAGHEVTLAEDGPSAIEAFCAAEFDLVLLDIVMPGMDGIEACRALRALPRGLETPMIFLTALADREALERAAQSGIDDLLWKPINRTELLVRVRALLRTKRLQDEQRRNLRLIQEQNEALVRSQQLKDALSSFVVHDLKSPLASLAVSIDAASIDTKLNPETLECLAGARDAVDMLSRMITNLLDISSSDSGAMRLSRRDVDLGALIEDTAAGLRRRAQRRRVEVTVEQASPPVHVLADMDLLRRTILNLLDNALRYSPSKGRIHIACLRQGSDVEVRVCDEGPGVPAEYAEKIFDRFFQVEAPNDADAQSNRGLGLTFCRLAIEAHGGRIWVEPTTPRGATFCFRLPERVGAGEVIA